LVHVLFDGMWNLSSNKYIPWGKGRNQFKVNVPIADTESGMSSHGRIVLLICSDWYRDSIKLHLQVKGAFDYSPSKLSLSSNFTPDYGEYHNRAIYFTGLPVSVHLCDYPSFLPTQLVFSYYLHAVAEQEVPSSYLALVIEPGSWELTSQLEGYFLNDRLTVDDNPYPGCYVLESFESDYTRPHTVSRVNVVYDIPKTVYRNSRLILMLRTHISSQHDGGVQFAYQWRKDGSICSRSSVVSGVMLPRVPGVSVKGADDAGLAYGDDWSRPYYG